MDTIMDILVIIVGLFMIALGFLVKSYPNLIAGYNTMSKDKKKNVDIEGLSSSMRNGLIIIGLTIMIGYFLFKWLGLTMIANSMILIVSLTGVIIMVVNAQKHDHNKEKKTKWIFFILGIVVVFVIGVLIYGFLPAKTVISNDTIRFSGMYGIEMKVTNIVSAELSERIPAIKLRTNGFSFGPVNKGTFNLDEFGKCRLLLHSDKPPYLVITKNDGSKIIVNYKDKTETQETYKEIVQLIGNR